MTSSQATSTYLIVGLGREGWSSYQFLHQTYPDAQFVLTDDTLSGTNSTALPEQWQQVVQETNTTILTAEQVIAQLQGQTYPALTAVISPGIPPSHPLLQILTTQNTPLTSNTNLFFAEIEKLPLPPITIGVTGTKGKSTTAAVIHHVLIQNSKYTYYLLGGNIGLPPLDLLAKIKSQASASQPGVVVLELSAHQLRLLTHSPHIAVLQNIVPEHLDYYPTFADYTEAKRHLVAYQTPQDFVICNQNYPVPLQMALSSHAHLLTFTTTSPSQPKQNQDFAPTTSEQLTTPVSSFADSTSAPLHTHQFGKPIAWVEDQTIFCQNQPVLHRNDLPLLGQHNLENVMPTIVIADHLGMSVEQISQALRTFQPLPHRLQKVAEVNHVLYVNDSLATTPESAVAALESFPDRPVVLIAGGYDRHLDYTLLAKALLHRPIRALLLLPTTGQQIAETLQSALKPNQVVNFPLVTCDSMVSCVSQAQQLAQPGDVVLLSPAAASFNMFIDYADRGKQFMQAVRSLSSPPLPLRSDR